MQKIVSLVKENLFYEPLYSLYLFLSLSFDSITKLIDLIGLYSYYYLFIFKKYVMWARRDRTIRIRIIIDINR